MQPMGFNSWSNGSKKYNFLSWRFKKRSSEFLPPKSETISTGIEKFCDLIPEPPDFEPDWRHCLQEPMYVERQTQFEERFLRCSGSGKNELDKRSRRLKCGWRRRYWMKGEIRQSETDLSLLFSWPWTCRRRRSFVEVVGALRPNVRGFKSRSSRHVYGHWASPSLKVACVASAWNSDTVSVLCLERFSVVVDLKKPYTNRPALIAGHKMHIPGPADPIGDCGKSSYSLLRSPSSTCSPRHILTAWMVGQMSHHCPNLSHYWNVSHHRYNVL